MTRLSPGPVAGRNRPCLSRNPMASPDAHPVPPTDADTRETHRTDIAIVGAGPVGLFTVFECGMLKMRCHVIDALDAAGGQCTALYPEKPIYDIPAWPEIAAGDLVRQLMTQAVPFDPVLHLGQRVVSLDRIGRGRLRLTTDKGTVVEAAAVMIAAGAGAFGPNRPPLDGIEAYEAAGPGLGVHYYVAQREDFRGKRIVIAGGGDSAVDWALSLADIAESVAFVHRRDKFRAAPDSVARLHALADTGKVEIVVPYQLSGLVGDGGRLAAVEVATLDGETRRLTADTLLPFFGLATDLGPIAGWGLQAERHQVLIDPATGETNIPGVYAIGDVAAYPGKLKLILTGFAEAARAAHSAHARVYPDTALHFEYSTTKGLPGR